MQLQIRNLSKTYRGTLKALENIHLTIDKGMFGLLGPNGAGKSTLMRTIATLQDPDSGSIHLGDIDVLNQKAALRKVLGYLPQDFGFYPRVTALDLLHHFAVLKGITDRAERNDIVDALLQQTNLYETRRRNLSEYSGGMRQRFGIAQALLGNPRLVIVDEPTAGLDPMERNRFYNILSEIGEQVIVILSTHIVEDVRTLCNKMVVMNKGRILLEGTPAKTVEAFQGRIWRKVIEKTALKQYMEQFKVISQYISEGKLIIHVLSDDRPEEGFDPVTAGLEDVYFSTIATN
ncbi:multidrug ABC transporter ATP-binding protein [Niabella ginsenosidivorans]|uniref:Multidrug ABC transporter ATP-binding protein n=1 Tax=Niabella ginsenosidivorans TaxID=1176587 RepID=A0A1A9I2S2_9BACT|nr:ABC transporter ATP-binding protein [Niabella ginsenosidivorans]ANH81359.1 multidrug ABC transporter ATP-binding protein [Niabella ginsenosidivorans]